MSELLSNTDEFEPSENVGELEPCRMNECRMEATCETLSGRFYCDYHRERLGSERFVWWKDSPGTAEGGGVMRSKNEISARIEEIERTIKVLRRVLDSSPPWEAGDPGSGHTRKFLGNRIDATIDMLKELEWVLGGEE